MPSTPYESLVEVASQIDEAGLWDDDVARAAQLVQAHRAVLDSARQILPQRCRVSVRDDPNFLTDHLSDLSRLRRLAQLFGLEAQLAASREDQPCAISISMDLLELANTVRRGGLIIDLLTAVAISSMGLALPRKLRAELDDGTRSALQDRLFQLEQEREAFTSVLARDMAWEKAVGGYDEPRDFSGLKPVEPDEGGGFSEEQQHHLIERMQSFAALPEPDQERMKHDLDRADLALLRLLRTDLALRTWRAREGTLPETLEPLVPTHLAELPLDPFTGGPFLYRLAEGGAFVLYSTVLGEDQT